MARAEVEATVVTVIRATDRKCLALVEIYAAGRLIDLAVMQPDADGLIPADDLIGRAACPDCGVHPRHGHLLGCARGA